MLKYRMTLAFLVVGAITMIAAALVVHRASVRSGENNLTRLVTEQSIRDARTVSGMVGDILAADSSTAAGPRAEEERARNSGSLETVIEFLNSSGIVRLTLYDQSLELIWSSADEDLRPSADSAELLATAGRGTVASALLRDVHLPGSGVDREASDVVDTYVPLTDADAVQTLSVLVVTRDVTETLGSFVSETRGAVLVTVLLSIGAGLIVILGLNVAADIMLRRSRARTEQSEQALGRERLAAAKLGDQNERLQLKGAMRDRFLNTVSHELKSPLASITAYVDILSRNQSGVEAARNREQLGVIMRETVRMKYLITDLLELSQLESGEVPISPGEIRVSQLIDQARDRMEPLLEAKGQTLSVWSDTPHRSVIVDGERVVQAITNLVSNSSKYSPEDTPIVLEISARAGRLRVGVRDRGIGISRDDQDQMFTDFFRSRDPATRSQPGSGLGLSIVKAIVEGHGGGITVDSGQGAGTTIRFFLPTTVVGDQPGQVVRSAIGPESAEGLVRAAGVG